MTVEVFADIACPFCYIGERHFEQALAEARGAGAAAPEVRWRWRPFQLQPGLPEEGMDWRAFAEKKFGGWERAQAAFRHVAEMGAAAGLEMHPDRIARAVNTAKAHRLVLWAAEEGDAGAPQRLAEALFAAYFTRGRDVGSVETLAALAEETGLDAAGARAMLASERFAPEVERSQEEARRLGVTGVPFYVFHPGGAGGGDAYAVSGAQPVAVFRKALSNPTPHAG